ncbi:MAG: TetR/AcrR family transcriptional regulator [Candidatus Limnocylindria bacterium]
METVKGEPASHRQRQARDTRARVVAAARALFAQFGYAATTIQAIAAESGVAVPTIYDAFKSKRGILEAARLVMLEESQIPALMAEADRASDPGIKLDLTARWVRQQMERSYDVIQAFREASRADPDAAADHRRILDRRARTLRRFIATLAADLAPGISPRTATDLPWAFSNEELYRELVIERGWSADRFEHWLASTLRAQLLGGQTSSDASTGR